MLTISDSVLDAKAAIAKKLEKGDGDPETLFREILELDPYDSPALVQLARHRLERADAVEAEHLLWRAIESSPCAWQPYLVLSGVVSEELSDALTELSLRKMQHDDSGLEEFEEYFRKTGGKKILKLEKCTTEEKVEILAESLRLGRENEPAAVTEKLRPYRLIQQLQEGDVLVGELVDEILGEGASIVPLLIGVLRDFMRLVLPEEEMALPENTLALLGEIGEVQAIPALLEMMTLDESVEVGAAGWAVNRIVSRKPDESIRLISEISLHLTWACRTALAGFLSQQPQLASSRIVELLFEGFESLPKDDRDACFLTLLMSNATLRGIAVARGLLRRYGSTVSPDVRGDGEAILADLSNYKQPVLTPSPDFEWNVYDICSGKAVWEEVSDEPDDEDYYPEPIRRPVTPGRNDPCWCGSGKKYKKCHLESDERQQREASQAASGKRTIH